MKQATMKLESKYPLEKLLFRRQFILGPQFIEQFHSWKRIKVRDNICITVHPDLSTYQVACDKRSVTLLGYILDPKHPEAGDSDIVGGLFQNLGGRGGFDNFVEQTHALAGRWILLVDDGEELRVFNDACGQRQVFYTQRSDSGHLWVASQPSIIAEVLGLEPDKDALEALSQQQGHNEEYWWLGDTTLYKEIRHLLPNHYLDLRTGLRHRYWPKSDLAQLSLPEAIERNAQILRGVLKSASCRFDLAFSLTAGRDTRLLLAAAREILVRLHCFSMIFQDFRSMDENHPDITIPLRSMDENHPDITIPHRLLSSLGMKNHIVKCPRRMEKDFERIHKRNVTTAHDIYGAIAQGLYHHYPEDKVWIKGMAIHVTKHHCCYRLRQRGLEVTPQNIALVAKMLPNAFALNAIENWFSEAPRVHGIDVLTLFEWENKEGSWAAMTQSELDIVHEVFVPFNCRVFLTNMLSVGKEYLIPPRYRFHEELIKYLWPELLTEPFNPHQVAKRRRKNIQRKLSKLRTIPGGRVLYRFVPQSITQWVKRLTT